MTKLGKSSRGHSQGVSKIFWAPVWGALRGHLCDSTAFLLFMFLHLHLHYTVKLLIEAPLSLHGF